MKLLERSVEELECTVNVLENKVSVSFLTQFVSNLYYHNAASHESPFVKVDIVKGEAERQRLQREELELELHSVTQQLQSLRNADVDMKRLREIILNFYFLSRKPFCFMMSYFFEFPMRDFVWSIGVWMKRILIFRKL